MAENIEVSKRDEEQAKALESVLAAPGAEAPVDICAIWRMVERFWPWIIEVVKKIPRVGAIIARVLQLLGDVLKRYCEGK